ncbi:hypothetical protein GOODEAATRI_031682, partial [Goodea atripinnis]
LPGCLVACWLELRYFRPPRAATGVQSALVRPQYLCPPSRRKRARSDQGLPTRVEQLSTELAELLQSLLQTHHSDASLPTTGLSSTPMPDLSVEVDSLSLAASASQLRDEEESQALSRLSTDGRVLAAMHESLKAGLDRMPAVEPAVASLIVSPGEALHPYVQCPRTQYRFTDNLLRKAYNAGARAGHLGNSMAHLMFALSASLQDAGGATAADGFSDAALQAFALMTRELGRVMSFLVQARRQVWLAQSALTEACRWTLRGVPVVSGELFGSAAVEALE